MNHPRILGIGTANPLVRLTQEQSFHAAGYQGERIRKIFLNSDIDHRHFYLEGTLKRGESSDQTNQRYLRGAMITGCRAILNCLKAARTAVQNVDFLAVPSCTGYVCPDVGSRLIAHMGFINNLQRASIVGLGCAGAAAFLLAAGQQPVKAIHKSLTLRLSSIRSKSRKADFNIAKESCESCWELRFNTSLAP